MGAVSAGGALVSPSTARPPSTASRPPPSQHTSQPSRQPCVTRLPAHTPRVHSRYRSATRREVRSRRARGTRAGTYLQSAGERRAQQQPKQRGRRRPRRASRSRRSNATALAEGVCPHERAPTPQTPPSTTGAAREPPRDAFGHRLTRSARPAARRRALDAGVWMTNRTAARVGWVCLRWGFLAARGSYRAGSRGTC